MFRVEDIRIRDSGLVIKDKGLWDSGVGGGGSIKKKDRPDHYF